MSEHTHSTNPFTRALAAMRVYDNRMIAYIGMLGVLVVFYILYKYPIDVATLQSAASRDRIAHEGKIELPRGYLDIDVSSTPAELELGLSGIQELSVTEGMLFVFPKDGIYSFWMKDMFFPLDIIWLDHDMRVVHIESRVSPATYPNAFRSKVPAKYVLEMREGAAEMYGVQVGIQVRGSQ